MTDFRQLVRQALKHVTEIEPSDLRGRLDDVVIIDVREPQEVEQGAISEALVLPLGMVEGSVDRLVPDRSTEVVIYCASGARSALAAKGMMDLGYTNVTSLRGGFDRWRIEEQSGKPDSLTAEQHARYSRHLLLPEVGVEGQKRLLEASILVVGAGGLGSPVGLYLAAAGVGRLGIVDFDIVDVTNLQRQIIHNVDRLGQPKAESARETLTALNPDVKIEAYQDRLGVDNVLDMMSGYDVVVDAGDNFPTRYLVNDASLHMRVPVVHGSIFRFDGQVTVFSPYAGPCYRCLFEAPPPPELAPSCAEAGVLGVLPGVIGSIQATEAIKLALGIGDSLVGRLLTYDALDQRFHELRIARNPQCPACADESRPPRLVEYDEACRPAGTVARTTRS